MSRLEKFVEIGSNGEGPTRAAYALEPDKLPKPKAGMQWMVVEGFNAGDEILRDVGMKDVFKTAIAHGYAIVNLTA
jgi:hypothetical protein